MGKIGLIARREFNERVRKKSFIITTILMPLCFVGIIVLMAWLMTRESDKERRDNRDRRQRHGGAASRERRFHPLPDGGPHPRTDAGTGTGRGLRHSGHRT